MTVYALVFAGRELSATPFTPVLMSVVALLFSAPIASLLKGRLVSHLAELGVSEPKRSEIGDLAEDYALKAGSYVALVPLMTVTATELVSGAPTWAVAFAFALSALIGLLVLPIVLLAPPGYMVERFSTTAAWYERCLRVARISSYATVVYIGLGCFAVIVETLVAYLSLPRH
jgi:hypothetical protein